MNSFIEFIVKDLLGQASILIAFIAMLGLILQKKSVGKTVEGTFKTLLGFLIMMAGINIIVATLSFLNDIFTHGFGMKGYITDVAAIAGLANRELGSEVALTLMVIFAVNIIIARLTPLKYIFLTGAGAAVDGNDWHGDWLQSRADRAAADPDRRYLWRRHGGTDAGVSAAGGQTYYRF
ncbi:Putative integral membrane protein [Raoultella ornithinolytica]|nr:Putative integral membrane protein [Raoultella ornithinolytica]